MSLFDKEEINELLNASQIGLWKVEFDEGLTPRFYADRVMDKLIGIEGIVTPEERYAFHRIHIHRDDLAIFDEYAEKIIQGRAEVVYRYMHPELGEMYVRCNGSRDKSVIGTKCIKGTHQDISDTIRLEKEKIAERRLAKKNRKLEEQLEIIQTLAKPYNSSYYIDLHTGSFFELGSTFADVKEIIGEAGDAQAQFEKMCQFIIKPEYADEMRKFTDLSTINERLKDKAWICMDFEGRVHGWSEGVFIAANRDQEGNCEHIIWATRSINQFKEKELLQQQKLISATKLAEAANNAKTAFLFNMSHDIRTPMNAIIGFTDLIRKNADKHEKVSDYIEKTRSASKFLLALIDNVLEMSRIENGRIELKNKVCSLSEIAMDIVDVFEEQMKQKNIDFSSKIDIIHDRVVCDSVKIREISLNILSNSYKYTPEGGKVTIEAKELPSDREGYGLYKTIISDTGIGMSEEFLPQLFDEFSREQSVTDNRIDGTGLGMSIVKKLVELCDGTIEAESHKGVGTTITVTMYHKIASDDIQEKKEESIEIDTESFLNKRILLAEDNDLNAEIAIEMLKEIGFIVDRVSDGMKCLTRIIEKDPGYYDVVLMDIQMPNMNGLETTAAIRALENEEKAQISIVAMTANAFEEDRKEAINAGMNGHISKPIDVRKLKKTLSEAMKK